MAVAEARSRTERLRKLLEERILVLDGAWGTMLQRQGLTPEGREHVLREGHDSL